MAGHVVLLGDSIFDNSSDTGGQPDVIGHLRAMLPASWRATLRAVDGCTTESFEPQMYGLPDDASHLVVSLGGNDALLNSDLLATRVPSTTEALVLFDDRLRDFERSYRLAIGRVLATDLVTTLCTIYNGNLPQQQARAARIGLMVFNDAILRMAFEHHLRVIDLRVVCQQPADYANAIEPSGPGGRKIAAAIVQSLEEISPQADRSMVFSIAPR
jgi:hypothetical protein